MDSAKDDESRRDDALMRDVFALAGRREAVDELAVQRAEEAFRRALAPVVERRKRRRRMTFQLSIAAALLAAVGIVLELNQPNDLPTDASIATLVKASGPVELLDAVRPLGETKGVRIGQVLMTGETGRASLRYRDADVRLDVATTVRFDAARLFLERGAIYVDTGAPRSPGEPSVLIETRFGIVGHTGTQFVARLDVERLTVGVRQGTVFVKSGTQGREMSAPSNGAMLAEIDASGGIAVHPIPAFDGVWGWVPQISSGFSVDGRSVDDYLAWLAREYGYSIAYDDAATASSAKSTILHGELDGMSISDAAAVVSATTQLAISLDSSGELRVASKRDHDAHPRDDRQQ